MYMRYKRKDAKKGRQKRRFFFLFPIIALFVNNIDNIIALED